MIVSRPTRLPPRGAVAAASLLLAVLALPRPGLADQVVSLASLEELALERSDLTQTAGANRELAEAQLERARAGYQPRVSVGAETALVPGSQIIEVLDSRGRPYRVQGSRAFGDQDAFRVAARYSGVLQVDGTLYDFGRTSSAVDAAEREREAAAETSRTDAAQLVEAVRRAYVAWFAADAHQRLAERAHGQASAQRVRIEEGIELGTRSESDLTEARYAEAAAELSLARAAHALSAALDALEFVVGQPLPGDAKPQAELHPELPDVDPESDPALRALHKQEAAARARVEQLSRTHRPVLGYALQAGAQGQDGTVFPAGRAELNFGVPLWEGRQEHARAREARARARAAQTQAEALRRSLEHDARRARLRLQQAREQQGLATTARDLAATAQRNAVERFEAGGGPLGPVLDARARLLEAESALIDARVALALASLGLAE